MLTQEDMIARFTWIQEILKDQPVTTKILQQSEKVPLDTLLVRIAPKEQEQEGFAEYIFLQYIPLQMEMEYLRFSTEIPMAILNLEKVSKQDLLYYLQLFNAYLLIGHFDYMVSKEKQLEQICFSYTLASRKKEKLQKGEAEELINLIYFYQMLMKSSLLELSSGVKMDQVLEKVRTLLFNQKTAPN